MSKKNIPNQQKRKISDARKIIASGKKIVSQNPNYVLTDCLNSYQEAIREEFENRTTHVKTKSLKEGLVDKIKEKMLTNSEERKISDLEDNLDFRILSILDLATELPQQSRNLYDLITLKLDELYKEEKRGDKILKQSLDRLGFRSSRISQGVMWSITREKIQEAKRKDRTCKTYTNYTI